MVFKKKKDPFAWCWGFSFSQPCALLGVQSAGPQDCSPGDGLSPSAQPAPLAPRAGTGQGWIYSYGRKRSEAFDVFSDSPDGMKCFV